ncbi:fimbria/pilus outer membrane usher protein [Pseudomonas sp. CMR5c]|uniref:fimbria/pilus outer membrane usher protein n=1 Tax=Pseudomonas TaxID=286 RepID=UPI000B183862|nr:fimbria/pilus outer membrane usher protein [Pseudomonas sp. CMR5c]AZC17216.1 Sigma-fimbriae usher protein [Pseudomonas sp. CMR5c]
MKRRLVRFRNVPCALAFALVMAASAPARAKDKLGDFKLPDSTLYLELVVNGKTSGEILPVPYRDGHYYLPTEKLRAMGVSVSAEQESLVAVDLIQGVKAMHDNARQQLLIELPPDWLPDQMFGGESQRYMQARSSVGLLMNYDIYANFNRTRGLRNNNRLSAWSEQRLFSPYGIFSNTGVWYGGTSMGDDNDRSRYQRYDTGWSYSDPLSMRKYAAGDLVTDALAPSSSVRMAGFQIGRNFATRPDLVTYPLPSFAGQTAVPSTVDLFINSYKMDSYRVDPGPFTLQTMPYINGAGSATVVTRDALGREVSKEVSFYVSNDLLKPGLTDYSLSAGLLRQDYGLASGRYAHPAASGVFRHGVTPGWTVFGWGEGASGLHDGGLGSNVQLGMLGVLTGSWGASKTDPRAIGPQRAWRNSRWDDRWPYRDEDIDLKPTEADSGRQLSYGYSYSSSQFSLNARRTQRSAHYANLGTYRNTGRLSRREDVVTASVALGDYGTVGAGWVDTQDATGRQLRLINLSHSVSLWRSAFLYTSVNREVGGNDVNAQVTLSIPLGDRSTTSVSLMRGNDGRRSGQVNYNHSAPASGGLGYSLGVSDGQDMDQYRRADVSWRGTQYEVRGGTYGTRSSQNGWAQLSGSLIGLDGQLYAANKVNDAFALVSTAGYPDVPVRYENQYLGKTNNNGYFLIPSMTSWYPARIQIDPIDLPVDVKTPDVETQVAVRAGSGYVVDFKLEKLRAALLQLRDSNGEALPRGSQVTDISSGATGWVGWEGEVYLENVRDALRLNVVRADDGKACQASVALPPMAGITRIGPQTCQ